MFNNPFILNIQVAKKILKIFLILISLVSIFFLNNLNYKADKIKLIHINSNKLVQKEFKFIIFNFQFICKLTHAAAALKLVEIENYARYKSFGFYYTSLISLCLFLLHNYAMGL